MRPGKLGVAASDLLAVVGIVCPGIHWGGLAAGHDRLAYFPDTVPHLAG